MTTPLASPAPVEGPPLAELQHVTKWYGPVIGLNDVSLRLPRGIVGLLGPNGAGKTTLIKLLTGQLRPDLGTVLISGRSAWSSAGRKHLGYCPDVDAFYEEMSGRGFVRTMARLQGLGRAEARDATDRALAEVGMSDRAHRTVRGYSKGMRQRIKLAQALVHDPQLLVVDEPLNGVDPVGRRELMELFRRLADRGKTVLVSSHILEEMDALAGQIVFMGRGRILAVGTLPEIRDMLSEQPRRVRIDSPRARELASLLIGWPEVLSVDVTDERTLALAIVHRERFFAALGREIVDRALPIDRVESTDLSAEATFDYVMSAAQRF
jgi:ABC-2 type transport system ATP-binding protein